jgi:membrane protease YdiL (CAAX protease family)
MKNPLLQDILVYLKNPYYKEVIERKPFFSSLFHIIRINLLSILLSFGAGIIITLISTKTNALEGHAVGDFIENESLLKTFIFACIVAPLLEESAFRLWLINKPLQVAIGLFGFLFYFSSSFIPGSIIKSIFTSVDSDNPIIVLGTYLALFIGGMAILYSIIKLKPVQDKLEKLYKNKYKWVFFGSAILFGLLHVSNYKFSWVIILFTPFLILPQVFGGILLSYIRVTYGFWRSVLGHFIYNLLLLTPSLGIKFMSSSSQKLLQSNEFDFNLLDASDKTILGFVITYFLLLIVAVIGSNLELFISYLLNRKTLTKL